jgi:hypothetical protein
VLTELTPREPSLEEAFFDLTNDPALADTRELAANGA